jgi:hypothetical protein
MIGAGVPGAVAVFARPVDNPIDSKDRYVGGDDRVDRIVRLRMDIVPIRVGPTFHASIDEREWIDNPLRVAPVGVIVGLTEGGAGCPRPCRDYYCRFYPPVLVCKNDSMV